ncbi:uncharacterized protein LOC110280174 [Arachis duranensis]|uniref:Uncharacterized protein LOC110280174 n=1 Tax=Arachis duranensis TaxID=130453 RepID=A0A6P5NKQ7_ARADU|nr:uncharacterized protein LOC110280174 [Arachis duranensis]
MAEAQLETGHEFCQASRCFTVTLYDRHKSEYTVAEMTPTASYLSTYMEANYYSMDEDDSYIEIELHASSSPSPLPSPRYNDKDHHEFHHHQLRISISSKISLSLQKDDAADDNEPPCMLSPINGDDATNNNTNTSALMFNNPGVGLIMESNPHKPEAQTTIQRGTHNMDAPCSRKQPNFTTKTRSNGGMTKLLIKFRGINIGAILASLIKPLYQPNNHNGHNKSSRKKHFQCYQKKLVNPTNSRRSNVKKDQGITRSSNNNNDWEFDQDEIICGSFRSCKKSSRKLEMDLGAIKGIFNAVGMNIADKKGSRSKRRSQPNSCDTTPIHEGFSLYTNNNNNNDNNNSIQAAIAYCKSSFGQTSDFSF